MALSQTSLLISLLACLAIAGVQCIHIGERILSKVPANGRWESEIDDPLYEPGTPVQVHFRCKHHQKVNLRIREGEKEHHIAHKSSSNIFIPRSSEPITFAVEGADGGEFELSVEQLDNNPSLQPGQSVRGRVAPMEWAYYNLTISNPGQVTVGEVTLVALVGDPDLYGRIGHENPTSSPGGYDYRSISASHDDQFQFTPGDKHFPGSCQGKKICHMQIGVHGFSNASFVLTATINGGGGDSYITLQMGIAQPGETAEGEGYEYYKFSSNEPLEFTLTPSSGDPDMYITNDGTEPSRENHQFKSNGLGEEVVNVPGASCNPNNGQVCEYKVAVEGFQGESASWTVVVNNATGYITLTDGNPQLGYVGEHHTNYYVITLPPFSKLLEVTISPFSGDPDLFITTNGKPPNQQTAQYVALGPDGQDTVVMLSTDDQWSCSGWWFCDIKIAVYGFSESNYFLTATTNEGLTLLRGGVASSGVVRAGDYKYYVMRLNRDLPLAFDLTPTSGDPDMFIGCGEITRPTVGSNYWLSMSTSIDHVKINPGDEHYCPAPSHYYVGVRGFNVNGQVNESAAFTIVGQLVSPNVSTVLASGQPQRGHAEPHELKYYAFVATGNSGVTFDITSLSGNVELYVNNEKDSSGNLVPPTVTCVQYRRQHNQRICVQWSVSNYHWSTADSSTEGSIVIQPGTVPANQRTFVLGVLDVSQTGLGSDFSLSARTNNSIQTLSVGVPERGSVPHNMYNYYRVVVADSSGDVGITLTSFDGDTDMYASFSQTRPDQTAKYHSRSVNYEDRIVIPTKDLQHCVLGHQRGQTCTLYVSTYGYGEGNNSYTIVAGYEGNPNSAVHLADGTPQNGNVKKQGYAYYIANANVQQGAAFSVSLESSSGDADLYINIGHDESKLEFPTQGQSMLHAAGTSGIDEITVRPGDQYYCTGCTMKISVYGFQESGFTITYASTATVTELEDGVPQLGFVGTENYTYYKFYVDDPSADVTFTLTPSSGDPDIFVIKENPENPYDRPTRQHYMWSASGIEIDSLTIQHTDSNFCYHCYYIIGVYGFAPSEYSIVAETSARPLVRLFTGQPQEMVVPHGQYRYFWYDFGTSGTSDVDIHVEAGSGAVETYVTDQYRPGMSPEYLPNKDKPHTYNFTISTPTELLHIPASQLNAANHRLTMGVYGSSSDEDSVITIVVTKPATVEELIPGVESPEHSIASGQMQYFFIPITKSHSDVTVSVEALSGDPDLAVSFVHDRPTCRFEGVGTGVVHCYNYTWLERQTEGESLLIPHSSPDFRRGNMYIGVFGFTNARYTVLVQYSSSSIRLQDGHPLVGRTSRQAVCQSRDPSTHQCNTEAAIKEIEWFTFYVPQGTPNYGVTARIERLCGGDTGACGPSLVAYMTVCKEVDCTASLEYPYGALSDYSFEVTEAEAAFTVPTEKCSTSNNNCRYNIGVMPQCGGFGCYYGANFTITVSTPEGYQLIDGECFRPGGSCAVGPESSPNHITNHYEAFMSLRNKENVEVAMEMCLSVADLYGCYDGGQCSTEIDPSKSNNDFVISTSNTAPTKITTFRAMGALYMSAVATNPNSPYFAYTIYVQHATAPYLKVPDNGQTVTASATSNSMKLSWKMAEIKDPQKAQPTQATKASYVVYGVLRKDILQHPVRNAMHVDTPCGMEVAVEGLPASDTFRYEVKAGTTTANFAISKPGVYDVLVVAMCDGTCLGLPNGGDGRPAKYNPLVVSAGVNPGPHPGPGGGGGGGGGSNGGKTAGIVIGILLAIAAVGVGGFFGFRWYKKRRDQQDIEAYYTGVQDAPSYKPL